MNKPGSPPPGGPVNPQPGAAPTPGHASPPGAAPMPGYAPPPGAAPGFPPPGAMQTSPSPGYPQPGAAPFIGAPPTNNLAIFGLILAFLGPCSMIGLILSIVALVQINRSYGAQKGKGLAIAGITVGILVLLGAMASSFLLVLFG